MWDQEELLKCIWHAFTALDVDLRGKVSKSQLKVLSVNLCAVMKIPFDLCELEKHFKGEEPGPLSNQGYMPYLSNYILNKVQDNFDILELFKFCWMLCYKKNLSIQHLRISHDDAYKVWCIFNLLSESKYPLYIVNQEIEYLLKMLTSAMGDIWSGRNFTEYHLERNLHDTNSLTVWELIELVGMHFFKNKSVRTLSTAINEVFEELILGILKQGHMVKRCPKGKNWTEYWFVLRTNSLEYYVSEDLMEIKGIVVIDSNCTVESLPDKDGKSCIFSIKSGDTSFVVSASDKMKKREWIKAIEKCIQIQKLGMLPPQRQAREERREQRRRQQVAEDKLMEQIKKLLATNENKQKQLETLEKMRLQVEEQVAQKSSELEHSLLRAKELENMYHSLQEALEDERQAKQDQEAKTELQARLLEEEVLKRAELEQMHLNQQRALSQSQTQRQELEAQMQDQERRLQEATQQLERLERQRARTDQHYQDVTRKLEHVANKCNNNIVITRYEGLLRLTQPGHKRPHLITNWGPSAFTEGELEVRKRFWQKNKNWSAAAE
ncbi:switch-associated protein 70-like isoform X2 [Boleophthalmus pectinirostris]|uniref:switch-associated protein 70-like isoform X2 n=1 Tax=Boleophthalmus pectinirostris TaxID=150288 RepID=UPI002431D3B9|nr:switch-associated protein 70-like isoform X2 [Boleophthalmus pectinirostris]